MQNTKFFVDWDSTNIRFKNEDNFLLGKVVIDRN